MKAVYKKDLLSLYTTILGFLFLGVSLAFYGLYFFAYNISGGQPTISGTVGSLPFLFLFAIPILSMRSFSEERKQKTDQLLLTSPVRVGSLIMGKFLSLLTTLAVVIGVIALSPLFLSFFGKVMLKESYTAILGLFLYGMASIAISLFISALTESQMISAILSIAVLFLGFMMKSITGLMGESVLTKILGCYDLVTPFESFQSGIIDLSAVVYYFSITAFALFLTSQVIEKRRWTVSSGKIRFTAFSIGSIALASAALVGVNVLMHFAPDRFTSFDMTTNRYYTLTDQTKKYVKGLKKDTTIYYIGTRSKADSMVKKTLDRFDASDHILVTYIDPDKDPSFTSKYSDEEVAKGSLIFDNEATKRSKVVPAYDLYRYDIDYSTYQQTVSGYDGEGQIMAALQYVNAARVEKICFVTGHDEAALGSSFTDLIKKKNMENVDLNLRTDEIPSDTTLLVLNGPRSDLSKDELAKLKAYLDKDKDLLITLNPEAELDGEDKLPNLKAFLAGYGIKAEAGLVSDPDDSHHAAGSTFILYPSIGSSDLMKDIPSSPSVIIPYACPVKAGSTAEAEVNIFLSTSDKAVIKTGDDLTREEGGGEENEGKEKGAYALGLSAVGGEDGRDHLYVLASSYTLIDNAESLAPGMNTKLFTNILSLSPDDGDGVTITIPYKSYEPATLQFTARAVILYGLFWGLVVPILLILFGLTVYIIRRKR